MADQTRLPRLPVRSAGHEMRDEPEVCLRPLPEELVASRRPRPGQPVTAKPLAPTAAKELAAALRGRAALRRAMLINEILGPPVALRGEQP